MGHRGRGYAPLFSALSPQERLDYEIANPEDPSNWRSLAGMVPKRSYIDLLPEEPTEEDVEPPPLPDEPDSTTQEAPRLPEKRHRQKSPWEPLHPLPAAVPPVGCDEYTPSEPPLNENDEQPAFISVDDQEKVNGTGTGVGSGFPTLRDRASSHTEHHRDRRCRLPDPLVVCMAPATSSRAGTC